MKVLIVGQGGREHALAWRVAQSSEVTDVLVAPRQCGHRLELQMLQPIPCRLTTMRTCIAWCKQHDIAPTIIGPEAPLAAGMVDAFEAAQMPCFGPTQAAARIESSKSFCKALMTEAKVPTPLLCTLYLDG